MSPTASATGLSETEVREIPARVMFIAKDPTAPGRYSIYLLCSDELVMKVANLSRATADSYQWFCEDDTDVLWQQFPDGRWRLTENGSSDRMSSVELLAFAPATIADLWLGEAKKLLEQTGRLASWVPFVGLTLCRLTVGAIEAPWVRINPVGQEMWRRVHTHHFG